MTTETVPEPAQLDALPVETPIAARSPVRDDLTADELGHYDHAVAVAIGAMRDLPEIARDLNEIAPRVVKELVGGRAVIAAARASSTVTATLLDEYRNEARRLGVRAGELETERDGYRAMLADLMADGAYQHNDALIERARAVLKHGVLGPKRFFVVDDGGASYYLVARDLDHAKSLLRDHGIEFTDDSGESAPIDDPRFESLEWLELSLEVAKKKIVTLGDSGAGPKSPLADCAIGEFFTSEI